LFVRRRPAGDRRLLGRDAKEFLTCCTWGYFRHHDGMIGAIVAVVALMVVVLNPRLKRLR